MDSELKAKLSKDVEQGGLAYIRNLIAAERAVLNGHFNMAKILRAAAHAQRTLAMNAARLLDDSASNTDLLSAIHNEIEQGKLTAVTNDAVQTYIEQSAQVRNRLQDILRRSIDSLQDNPDVLESDVAQILSGCYSCGAILEDQPDACPICGALNVEFEWFGPFYSTTPEHLGQLRPAEIIDTLGKIPELVESVIADVDVAVLQRKPSPDEWCAAEIVGHILETDKLFLMRAQAVLAGQKGEVPRPMPPWKLHEGKGYESMTADELMTHLRAAREQSLELVKSLTDEDWTHSGLNLGRRVTMIDLSTWLTNHDLGHLEQVKRLCAK